MSGNIRKNRVVYGPNFKWNGLPNYFAYLCFRVKATQAERESIANKICVKYESLNNRIQHFRSLSPDSNSKTTKPSMEVKQLFESYKPFSTGFCKEELDKFLMSSYISTESESDLNFETEVYEESDSLSDYFQQFWTIQKKYQKQDMSQLPWDDFIKIISTMNIKSRGIKIEKRVISLNSFRKSVMKLSLIHI